MANIKDYSVGAIVGMTIAAMVNLGIFATKADIANLKADVALNYMKKDEITPIIVEMQRDIRKILIRLGDDRHATNR